MLIVRGVNVFPTAIREVVAGFAPRVTGVISVRPRAAGFRQDPPLPVVVELADGEEDTPEFASQIRQKLRDVLLFAPEIQLVPAGTLPRTDYKSKLVDRSHAAS
jgi:phenylacetate-CoA ligase